MITQKLTDAISAVAPIHGVSIGRKDDRSTWRLDFKDEATANHRADAQATLLAFDIAPYDPPTQDVRAALSIDSVDRLQFDVLFQHENHIRALRALINTIIPGSFTLAQASQITRAQFRDALIDRWKALNP